MCFCFLAATASAQSDRAAMNAQVSYNVNGARINSLPVNFSMADGGWIRNPFSLIELSPGTRFYGQGSIRVNGVIGFMQMRFEGQESSSANDPNRSDEIVPSVEVVQEFTLQTANYSAEFGQVTGGLFNFTAKSGTNQFHGSLYEYFAQEELNAGIPFTDDGNGHLVRPRARKNDYGFSVGSPVFLPKVHNVRVASRAMGVHARSVAALLTVQLLNHSRQRRILCGSFF